MDIMSKPTPGVSWADPDGGNSIHISVPDIASVIALYIVTTGVIQLQSSATATGAFTDLTTLPLVTDQPLYTYAATTGVATTWYRYRFENAAGTTVSAWSDVF